METIVAFFGLVVMTLIFAAIGFGCSYGFVCSILEDKWFSCPFYFFGAFGGVIAADATVRYIISYFV